MLPLTQVDRARAPAPAARAKSSIEIAGLNLPAEERGGDFCDCVPLDSFRLAVAIGDACGHGLRASRCGTETRARLEALLLAGCDPGLTLRRVNRELARTLPDGWFVSLLIVELDARSGSLRYASAGHTPALLMRAEPDRIDELAPTGPALGIFEDASFETAEISPLSAGDLLLMHTDGVTEAKGPGRQRFGMDRVKHHLRGLRSLPVASFVMRLADELRRFRAGGCQSDDCSMVAIKAFELCRIGT